MAVVSKWSIAWCCAGIVSIWEPAAPLPGREITTQHVIASLWRLGMLMKFQHSASLLPSICLLFCFLYMSICIQGAHFDIKYALPDFPLVLCDALSWRTLAELGAGSEGQEYTLNCLFLHDGSCSVNDSRTKCVPGKCLPVVSTQSLWTCSLKRSISKASLELSD